jgi:formylglycine-generating enzyme required for sulfatase activity
MTDSASSHRLVFGELLEHLRRRGFTLGVDHYLRLHVLLEKIDGRCTPQDLKTLLCPIFAADEAQQEQFYRSFDEYYSLFEPAPTRRAEEIRAAQAGEQQRSHPPSLAGRKWLYVLSASLLVALIFVVALRLLRTPAVPSNNVNLNSNVADLSSGSKLSDTGNTAPAQANGGGQATPAPVESHRMFYDDYRNALRVTAVFVPLVCFLCYEWYRFQRRKLFLQRQRGKKPPFTWPLRIESSGVKPYGSARFYTAARFMRRRQPDELYQLDIGSTIAATVESLGYVSFRYKRASRPPEYLMLIDRASFRDHQAQLFNELAKSLEHEGVFVERYFYDGDPRVCCVEAGGRCLHLAELHHRFSGHRLLIFGDGEQLMDSVTGRLASWTSAFQHWRERVVMTPAPTAEWGMREAMLGASFVVLPATSEGLLVLVDRFESLVATTAPRRAQDGEAACLTVEADGEAMIEELRRYLGEELFQWLAACAVYPEMQWDLTLYLGQLPCMGENLVKEENLLRLVRLPWFRTGSMPDELRWHLIQELDGEKERAIRSAIIGLLEKNPPPKESFADDAYQLNLVAQRWLRGPGKEKRRELSRALEEIPQGNVIRDYTLVRFLESAPSTPLNLILPQRLRKLFYRHGVPSFGLRTAVRLLITLSVITAIWIVMGPSSSESETLLRAVGREAESIFPPGRGRMMAIPGGTFMMGRDDGAVQDAPAHPVTVGDFFMDETEVTNAEYAEFVNETKHPPPSHWPDGKIPGDQEQWPVANVSLDDARAFAAWRSKRDGVTYRLPTEEEWEYAARNGQQGNLYPWGTNSPILDNAVIRMPSPQPVGSFRVGRNRWGVVDLIGNVWEWTQSKPSIYPGNRKIIVPPQDQDSYVIRGGSYASEISGERAITAAFRDWFPPSTRHPALGFRLVRSGR